MRKNSRRAPLRATTKSLANRPALELVTTNPREAFGGGAKLDEWRRKRADDYRAFVSGVKRLREAERDTRPGLSEIPAQDLIVALAGSRADADPCLDVIEDACRTLELVLARLDEAESDEGGKLGGLVWTALNKLEVAQELHTRALEAAEVHP